VRWNEWITPQQTLRVDASAWRSPLQSLNFAALRIKDAVCDQMREACGERPSVDTHHPDLSLVLHLGPDHASLSVDLSGEALFKRGWREAKGEAPLKETLAAAMLAAIGWQGRPEDGGLLDPAAAPAPSPSRPRRSPAASRPACSAASPSSACCPSATSWAPGAR
jgi:putative N6-adenine-specific DNA methylase